MAAKGGSSGGRSGGTTADGMASAGAVSGGANPDLTERKELVDGRYMMPGMRSNCIILLFLYCAALFSPVLWNYCYGIYRSSQDVDQEMNAWGVRRNILASGADLDDKSGGGKFRKKALQRIGEEDDDTDGRSEIYMDGDNVDIGPAMMRSRQLKVGGMNSEGRVKDTLDEWLDMMWLKFEQPYEGFYETDQAFRILQGSFKQRKDFPLTEHELQDIADYFYATINDENGYCSQESLRETILKILPGGKVCIRLIDTYEVEPVDLNSDDDGDLDEQEESEAEIEEDPDFKFDIDRFRKDVLKKKFRKNPSATNEPETPGQKVEGSDVTGENFNIFDRSDSKDKKEALKEAVKKAEEEAIQAQLSRKPTKQILQDFIDYEADQSKEKKLSAKEKVEVQSAVKDLGISMGIKIEELYYEFLEKANDIKEDQQETDVGPKSEDYTMLAAQIIGSKLPLNKILPKKIMNPQDYPAPQRPSTSGMESIAESGIPEEEEDNFDYAEPARQQTSFKTDSDFDENYDTKNSFIFDRQSS